MVEKPVHYRVERESPDCGDPSWEVFVRDDAGGDLRHVGTLPAPSERAAYEQSRRLFGWFVHDLWLAPAAEVGRYVANPPEESAEPVEATSGEEPRTHEV
jgi:rSAM-partnered protein